MLQLVVVAQLPLIANFFNFQNYQRFALDDNYDEAQIYKFVDDHKDNKHNRNDENEGCKLESQRVANQNKEDFRLSESNDD